MALWITAKPVELSPNATEEDLQAVIRAVYTQVLGNAYVMESERLTSGESLLRNGDITVRGFVRFVAQSELYRTLFFDTASPYRFVEHNCRHLLGRAPRNQAEVSEHVQIYNSDGYAAEIDSYIDSEEYSFNFGENTVPYPCGTESQAGAANVNFNRSFALMRGTATSSSSVKSAQLISALGSNLATEIQSPASAYGAYTNPEKRFVIKVAASGAGPRVTRSNTTITVNYSQLSPRIQSIHKTGGAIVSITEA